MGTYTTGIPLITRNIQPPPIPERRITVNKTISNSALTVACGILYNGYAVNDSRFLANTGWHVPTLAEWDTVCPSANLLNLTCSDHRNADGSFDTDLGGQLQIWTSEYDSVLMENTVKAVLGSACDSTEGAVWRKGLNVRLIKDSTTLLDGETGTYVGNNGFVYSTICIGSQEWLTDNLCETRYRNGDWIAFITTDSTWAILTSGAYCFYNNTQSNAYTYIIDEQKFLITIRNTVTGDVLGYEMVISQEYPIVLRQMPYGIYEVTESALAGYTNVSIIPSTFTISASNPTQVVEVINSKDPIITTVKYGALYNFHAAIDVRNITNTGWSVPTRNDFITLETYLGGGTVAGGKLKTIGLDYWNTPNTGADNSSKFYGKGSGYRDAITSVFIGLKISLNFWTRDEYTLDTTKARYFQAATSDYATSVSNIVALKSFGASIRLIKDSTTLTHGQTGTYTGNDGKVYRTICIGTQEWLADNLYETKFRDGSDITVVTDNSAWAALATEGMCYYNNDESTYA